MNPRATAGTPPTLSDSAGNLISILRKRSGRASIALLVFGLALSCDEDPTFNDPSNFITPTSMHVPANGGNQQTGPAGEQLALPLIVRVYIVRINTVTQGRDSTPDIGSPVTWTVQGGAGTVSPVTSFTDANGQAQTSWMLGPTAGPQSVSASHDRISNVSVTFTATASPPAPSLLDILNGDNQAGTTGLALSQDLAVKFRRDSGSGLQPFAGATIAWTVLTGGGTVTQSTSTTDANGTATVRWTLGNAAGAQTLRATKTPRLRAQDEVIFTAFALPTGDIILEDNFDVGDQWISIRTLDAPDNGWLDTVGTRAAGGNSGGYRHMKHIMTKTTFPTFVSMSVTHFYTGPLRVGNTTFASANGYYDPRALGAITSIEYSEDRITMPVAVGEGMMIEQGGNWYYAPLSNGVVNSQLWIRATRTLTPGDFSNHPDFSATGQPIRFGYFRSSSERFPQIHEHGIDNFRVVVKRQ